MTTVEDATLSNVIVSEPICRIGPESEGLFLFFGDDLMTNKEDPIVMFGLVCASIANTMDEEGLSTEDALNAVRRMLQPISKTKAVLEAVSRLEAATNEADLWQMLQQEARLAKENHWPTSLFDSLDAVCTGTSLTQRKRKARAYPLMTSGAFMREQENHVPGQWVYLSAVANAMEEQQLSTTKAMAMLQEFLSEQRPGPAMRETVRRIANVTDESELRLKLGEECLRLMELDEQISPVKRSQSNK